MDVKETIRRAGELADSDKPDEAMELCNRVLLEDPDNPGALFVASCVCLQAARHVHGIQLAKRTTEVAPRDSRGWKMLALLYGELHKYDLSLQMAERAVALQRTATNVAALAYACVNGGEWAKGERYALEALKLAEGVEGKTAQDARRDASIHLMYCRLARGDWERGFADYRLTMRTKWRKEWTYGASKDGEGTREWKGEPDAVVMVTGEQGLGDEIMAASVVPQAAKACTRFILDCDHRLTDLFRRSFPDALVVGTRREQQVRLPVMPTHHKSLFGLAELFRKREEDFPRVPFLVPRADYVAMFRQLFGGKRTIGLAWSGGLPRTGEGPRLAGLNAFLPLIRRGEAQFVSLQYKDDAAEVAAFERQYGFKVMRLPWVTQAVPTQDIDLLAGMLAALDGVVGVHTSSLHLASALGVPATVIAHRGSGWRYASEQLLWYPPTTQLHKKRPGESWRDAVERLCGERERMAA